MENIKHCAVLVRNSEDVWEGSRAALGLAVGNYYGHLFVLDVIVNMTEELKENMDEKQEMLMHSVSRGKSALFYALFTKEQNEYDQLIDLIFEYDQIITWW